MDFFAGHQCAKSCKYCEDENFQGKVNPLVLTGKDALEYGASLISAKCL